MACLIGVEKMLRGHCVSLLNGEIGLGRVLETRVVLSGDMIAAIQLLRYLNQRVLTKRYQFEETSNYKSSTLKFLRYDETIGDTRAAPNVPGLI